MRRIFFVVCCMLLLSCRMHGEQRTSIQAPVATMVSGADFVQALQLINTTFQAQTQDMQQLRLLSQQCVVQIEAERFRSRVAFATGGIALALSIIAVVGCVVR